MSDSVIQNLQQLHEFRPWMMGLSLVLILAAILGGGIKVQSVEIPQIGKGGRLASAALGLALLVAFFVIPRPDSFLINPAGEIVLRRPVPEVIKLDLLPQEPLSTTEFPGTRTKFQFPKAVPEGHYRLRISSLETSSQGTIERRIDEAVVQIQRDQPLRLSQNPDNRFRSGQERSLVVHLIQKFKDRDWGMQVVAMEQLTDLAPRDESVLTTLRKMVQSTDQAESILAALSLSQNCIDQDQATKNKLREIWEGPFNPYHQIRARAAQQCDPSEKTGVESDLLDIVMGRGPLISGARSSQQRGLKTMAAYSLAMARTPRQCVVETLIAALGSPTKLAQDRAYEALKALSRESRRSLDKTEWENWWGQRKGEYLPCQDDPRMKT